MRESRVFHRLMPVVGGARKQSQLDQANHRAFCLSIFGFLFADPVVHAQTHSFLHIHLKKFGRSDEAVYTASTLPIYEEKIAEYCRSLQSLLKRSI